MSDDKWGPGDKIAGAKVLETLRLGPWKAGGRDAHFEADISIVRGEHPHSRRDENYYARLHDGDHVAFSGSRLMPHVEVWEENYIKSSSFSGTEVRRVTQARIYFRGHLVYGFATRHAENALRRCADLITQLAEHSIHWAADPNEWGLIGRRVYYQRVPAVVKYHLADQGAVVLVPESPAITFPLLAFWFDDDEHPEPHRQSLTIDIFDDLIRWHRE